MEVWLNTSKETAGRKNFFMDRVSIQSYLIILGIVFLYHAFPSKVMIFTVPLLLYIYPLCAKEKLRFHFGLRDLKLGLTASVLILLAIPIIYLRGGGFHLPGPGLAVYQLFGVALPEEVYFRGFLQERMGNNMSAVVIVSILFSIIHLPQLIFYGRILSPLTFFPSLIMGYLYLRTGNVLTSTVFHFLANIVFYGLEFRSE